MLGSLTPEKLARRMDANPARRFVFETGDWSAEHSVILATRPYPLKLTLCSDPLEHQDEFQFEDDGTAFVDALERRQSPFGSLCLNFDGQTNRTDLNLERLLNLDFFFEKLTLSMVYDDVALLPFSALTHALEYEFDANCFAETDFDNLNILTRDLNIKILFDSITMNDDYNDNWDRRLVSFLNRLGALGHFTKLKIAVDCGTNIVPEPERVDAITDAFIAVIDGNPNLAYLNLSGSVWRFDWTPQLEHIFRAVEEHPGLRKLVVKEYPLGDTNYSWLKRLLSCNRNITVLDGSGERCSDGSGIDMLYALNRLYNGPLDKKSGSSRALLVGTVLVGRASGDFRFSALLLSRHTDGLCELLQEGVAAQSAPEEAESLASHPHDATESPPKRMRTLE